MELSPEEYATIAAAINPSMRIFGAEPEGANDTFLSMQAGVRAVVERVDGLGLISRVRDKSACQRIICQSRTIRGLLLSQRELLRCRPKQIVVVPNGIDLRRFDPSRYDRDRCRKRNDQPNYCARPCLG